MQVKTQLLLFLGFFSFVFLSFIVLNTYFSSKSKNLYIKNQEEKLKYVSLNSMQIINESVENLRNDYTFWDEMQEFCSTGDTAFSNQILVPNLETFIDYIWAYNFQAENVYSGSKEKVIEILNPFSKKDCYNLFDTIENSLKKEAKFFIKKDNTICVVFGGTVHPTIDVEKKTKPTGFIFFGKIINDKFLQKLGLITDAKATIVFDTVNTKSSDKTTISAFYHIYDYKNNYIASIYFERKDYYLIKQGATKKEMLIYIIIFTVLTIVISFLLLNRIVSQPLQRIIYSLDNNKIKPIKKYLYNTNEFGKIARLIKDFFKQKDQLQKEIAQRKQTMFELENAMKDLKLKNIELELQKEEILTQTDNLKFANHEILLQKDLIEKNHKKITDSILYAERIQTAVLPELNFINIILPNHFIFFKPKDIVSGDFYFVKQIKNYSLLAVADSTGHGVPGAFMSMLGIALLNEITLNPEIICASQVLDQLRFQMKNSLQQTGQLGEQQDGMDIAFCAIDLETEQMSYSGANISLWIFRPDEVNNSHEFIKLQADKQPVGVYFREKPFTEQNFLLKENDSLYLFTDGYHSQLSHKKFEKFSTGRLKNLLSQICFLPMKEQKIILEVKHEEWKVANKQTDDILILGVKI